MTAPEAYWALSDWRALIALMVGTGGVSGLAGPFIVAWWKGRSDHLQTAGKLAETAAERVERIQREQYLTLERDRDWHVRRGDQLQAVVDKLEASMDATELRFRTEGRAMDDWAHWYRHELVRTASRYSALYDLFVRYVEGRATLEQVQLTLSGVAQRLPQEPPGVPLLSDAPANRPPSLIPY